METADKSLDREKFKQTAADHTYILNIIQFLEEKWGIFLFVSARDFDVLYRWWEKQIPLKVVYEAINRVVTRWNYRVKDLKSVANFSYEVKKMFQNYLELNVELVDCEERRSQFAELDDYLEKYPDKLQPLLGLYQEIVVQIKAGKEIDLSGWQKRLLEQFVDDEELDLKVRLFLRNLAPELRNEAIARQYRLNYLANRFRIPDLDIFCIK